MEEESGSDITDSFLKKMKLSDLTWPDCLDSWEAKRPCRADLKDQFRTKISLAGPEFKAEQEKAKSSEKQA